MKKNCLVTIAMAALIAAGCSQNEIMDISADSRPAVGFKAFTEAQTRGTVTDALGGTTGLQAKGFGVFAYYTGQSTWAAAASTTAPNFMYNQIVNYNSTDKWNYTPQKYWPNTEGDKISFFAYGPHSTSANSGIDITGTTTSTNNAPTLKFTLKADDPLNLIDLVATDATQNSGANNTIDITKRTSTVSFNFKHVLTRATFKAKLDASLTGTSAATHIFVTDMRILGTAARTDNKNSGNNVAANSSSKFYSAATYKWNDGTWDYASGKATAQANPYPLVNILNLNTTTVSGLKDKYTTKGIELPQAATVTELFKVPATNFLFLIPPANTTGISAATDVRVQLDYDIVTVDNALKDGYSITSTTATVSLPTGTLKKSTAYVFTFTVGLEKVQVSAAVEGWGTAGDVAIPSVEVASATAANIATAIGTLNTTKFNNKNCNYFMVNIKSGTVGALNLSSATVGNFASGDKIELKFAANPGVTSVTLPTGWSANPNTLSGIGSIILTKD